MTAYNALNGITCTANNFLLRDILRNEWNFPGWVVTDCGAIYDIHINHKFIIDPVEAVAASLKAGTDLNCGSSFRLYLHEAFERGLVDMKDIDRALIRLFASRIKLGVLDPPYMNPYSKISMDVVDSEKHKSLAHEIARQSIVLLKNENKILPLKKAVRSIAVIGPNANFSRFGTYSGTPSVNITPLEGIKTVIPDAKIVYSQGTTILETELPTMPDDLFYTPEGISGVKAEYFVGFDMEEDPILIRTEKSPNISWEFDKTPDSILFEPNYFSVRFSGNIIVKESGNYKINVNGIDGLKFSFMENELIDKMSENYSHTTFKTDYLIKGKPYPFSLEYFEDEGWGEVRLGIAPIKKGLIEDAISKAKSSELVIMVLGTYDYIESEGRDRAETDLPLDQKNLLKKVYEVNQNLILVMVNGSTISLPWASKNIPAIVEAWYPGQSGGKAIAEVLFGDFNPGGKLPMTFYKNIDQLPPFDDYDIRKGRTYMYLKEDPLYPFGYGLSYTNFSITQISLNNEEFSIKDTIKVNFTLQNIGSRKGSEVPQVYIEHNGVKKLKFFNRIFLESNESSEILFKIPISDLERWDSLGNKFSVPSGQYMIQLGTSSADLPFSQNFIVK